jgi:hypothetical protein
MMTTLTITQGDSYQFPITVSDEDTGQAIDITSGSLYCTVKQQMSDADPGLCQLTEGSGITLRTQSGATLGMADIKFTPAQTTTFPAPSTLLWDVQYDDGVGGVWTVAGGIVAVEPQVTRHT